MEQAWQFFVTFLGWLSDPFKGLSDLQLGDEKGTLDHLENLPSIPTNSFFLQILQSSTTTWQLESNHTFRSCDSTPNTWHLPCIISGQRETCQTFTLQCFGCPKRRQGRGEIGEIEDDGCITREVLQETWRIYRLGRIYRRSSGWEVVIFSLFENKMLTEKTLESSSRL